MKTKFLQASIGISMILLAAGFFIRSIDATHAEPNPEKFFEQGTNKIGKYMWIAYVGTNGNANYTIWDTETGKSKRYYFDKGWILDNSIRQLPEKPME